MTRRLQPDDNIVLIGMPGVGKSTAGVLLAKATGREFIDTDVAMQVRCGRRLQEIIDADGLDVFRRIEQARILELDCRRHVIATGGSVVYSAAAMAHLKAGGPVVHLDLPLERIIERIEDLDVRGVVMEPGLTLADLHRQRQPLYQRYADLTVQCDGLTQDQVVAEIIRKLGC
ncbi:MAG TPA: shikimate kinase [Phycisphaerae bacterium]|nr:shikimate kinase [Phycisphaerae bacterium]